MNGVLAVLGRQMSEWFVINIFVVENFMGTKYNYECIRTFPVRTVGRVGT